MTPFKAYSIICDYYKCKPKVRSCKKFINGYGFLLAPEDSKPDEKIFVGGSLTCVDENGNLIEKSIFEKLPYTINEVDVKIFKEAE